MKELENIKPEEKKVVAGEIKNKPTLYKMGRERLKRGHKVWRLDSETGEITEFKDFKGRLVQGKNGPKVTKEIHRIGNRYAYVLCLNKKNAIKKFIKLGHQNVNLQWKKKK